MLYMYIYIAFRNINIMVPICIYVYMPVYIYDYAYKHLMLQSVLSYSSLYTVLDRTLVVYIISTIFVLVSSVI